MSTLGLCRAGSLLASLMVAFVVVVVVVVVVVLWKNPVRSI
jgi:hypothetical protein